MKQIVIISIFAIISILIISGCAERLPPAEEEVEEKEVNLSPKALETKALIEKLSKEKGLIEGENVTPTAETTEELLERLSREAGLVNVTEEEENVTVEEEEEEEIPEQRNYTITIEMFVPDTIELEIAANSSITWINNHPNFMHIIGIREKLPSGRYDQPITQNNKIFENQTFTFTFEELGTYQWYSSTKYPTTSGLIEVK